MDHLNQFFTDHQATIFTTLFFVSELLAQIPSVKANSIFQLIVGFLAKKQPPKAE